MQLSWNGYFHWHSFSSSTSTKKKESKTEAEAKGCRAFWALFEDSSELPPVKQVEATLSSPPLRIPLGLREGEWELLVAMPGRHSIQQLKKQFKAPWLTASSVKHVKNHNCLSPFPPCPFSIDLTAFLHACLPSPSLSRTPCTVYSILPLILGVDPGLGGRAEAQVSSVWHSEAAAAKPALAYPMTTPQLYFHAHWAPI